MNFQNMAPNAKRALLLTLAFGAVAAGLYFGAVEPTEAALAKARRALRKTATAHRTMMTELARAERIDKDLAERKARLDGYRAEMIEPLLESTAMRAKSILDTLATGCGLVGMEYETQPEIVLPVVGKAPARPSVRCPIRITCRGSYQAAVSFVRCVERRFPLVALGAFSVTALANPDQQLISLTLEWPMEKGGQAK